MPKASEYVPSKRLFALFVGRSKGAKTSAAITFPTPYDLDFDGRISGGIEWAKEMNLDLDTIQYMTILPPKGWKEVDKFLDQLAMNCVSKINKIETLIVDSLTNELRLFVSEAMDLQKGFVVENNAKTKGGLRLEGPGDYKYEAAACYQVFDFLRSLPINVIVTAHIIDKFGKLDPNNDYSETGIVGEKLSIRDKIGENILTFFDEVYRFEKRMTGKNPVYTVCFNSDLANSSLIKDRGEQNITGKNFYEFWKERVKANEKPGIGPTKS